MVRIINYLASSSGYNTGYTGTCQHPWDNSWYLFQIVNVGHMVYIR